MTYGLICGSLKYLLYIVYLNYSSGVFTFPLSDDTVTIMTIQFDTVTPIISSFWTRDDGVTVVTVLISANLTREREGSSLICVGKFKGSQIQ